MHVRSDKIKRYSSARSLVTSGTHFLDANESQINHSLACYGKRQNKELIDILSRNYGVSSDSVIYDRGMDEIISLVFRACCDPGNSVRIFTPTYGMYSVEASIQGLNLDILPLTKDGILDLEGLKNNLGCPSLVVLCRPNNPLGTSDIFSSVEELLNLYKDICPVFIDEAYAEFSVNCDDLIPLINNYDLILGRTLSKAYGLAGLRFGCALSNPQWIERLATVQKPYPVSKIVEDYIVQNFFTSIKQQGKDWVQEVRINRTQWESFFTSIFGRDPFLSEANFITFLSENSKQCYQFLKNRGVVTRLFDDNLIRITIGNVSQLKEIKSFEWNSI